jgi:flagellar motor switch/type III secretory pathway protein FliN
MESTTAITNSGESAMIDRDFLAALEVRGEIALNARFLTAEDLARLQPGQVIDLGVTAREPFDLVIDNRPIARGELIDAEGRLGLRILYLYR